MLWNLHAITYLQSLANSTVLNGGWSRLKVEEKRSIASRQVATDILCKVILDYFSEFWSRLQSSCIPDSQILSTCLFQSDCPWRPLFSKCLEDCSQQKPAKCVGSPHGKPGISTRLSFTWCEQIWVSKYRWEISLDQITVLALGTQRRMGLASCPRGAPSLWGKGHADRTS